MSLRTSVGGSHDLLAGIPFGGSPKPEDGLFRSLRRHC